MKKYLWLFLFFTIVKTAGSQSFGFDDTLKVINKPTDASTPPHEYFQIYNFTGDSLYLRWKLNDSLTDYPAQWQIALQDNEYYHNPIIDSNDIVVFDSAGTMDKLVINVYSNAFAGYGEVVLDVYNLDSLEEAYRVIFQITIYDPHANSILENAGENSFQVYPNPADKLICFQPGNPINIKRIFILDIHGKEVMNTAEPNLSGINCFDIAHFPPGLYLIYLESDDSSLFKTRFIKGSE